MATVALLERHPALAAKGEQLLAVAVDTAAKPVKRVNRL
jgi:hypothetical protein